MTTISVPLPEELTKFIDKMVDSKKAENKAAVVRRALYNLSEQEALNDLLEAHREVDEGKILKGNLDELAKSI
jgi:Arc/MetJ-type ribon-helix-helix transcriptional regulator